MITQPQPTFGDVTRIQSHADALEKQVIALQAELASVRAELAKPKEIGLLSPVPDSGAYYYRAGDQNPNGLFQYSAYEDHPAYYKGFASTNLAQAEAFNFAINVMAELRRQPGIVAEMRDDTYSLFYCKDRSIAALQGISAVNAPILSPLYRTRADAKAALAAVGEHNFALAFEHLLFLTPESRGEVPNA